MSVASSADDFFEDCLGSVTGIHIDGRIINEGGVEGAGEDFTEIGDRLLVEFLRVANVTEGKFIEEEFYFDRKVLFPALSSVCMVLARVGTTPRTAYSDSFTQGFICVQKKFLSLLKLEIILRIIGY